MSLSSCFVAGFRSVHRFEKSRNLFRRTRGYGAGASMYPAKVELLLEDQVELLQTLVDTKTMPI